MLIYHQVILLGREDSVAFRPTGSWLVHVEKWWLGSRLHMQSQPNMTE